MASGMTRQRHCLAALALSLCCAGCNWPKDPAATTEHVRGHELRAGVSENPPWIRFEGAEVKGVEADLIRGVASQLHAQVRWVRGGETSLFERLQQNELDLVAGGVSKKSPWAQQLGTTTPFATVAGEKHVLITAAGENRWLLTLDDYIHDHKDQLAHQLLREPRS
jgi:polar amino acid transport system substrate-binding protein